MLYFQTHNTQFINFVCYFYSLKFLLLGGYKTMKSKDFKHAKKILVFNSKIKGGNKKFNYSVIITTIINMYYLHHAFKTIIQKNQNALVK